MAHVHEKLDFTVEAFIVNKSRVLLRGDVPNFEMGPGRRLVLSPRFMDRHPINETHEHLVMYYFATSESDKVSPRAEEDRSDEWKWFTAEELNDPKYGLMGSIRFIAGEALRELN